jgi:hypothetical protein
MLKKTTDTHNRKQCSTELAAVRQHSHKQKRNNDKKFPSLTTHRKEDFFYYFVGFLISPKQVAERVRDLVGMTAILEPNNPASSLF